MTIRLLVTSLQSGSTDSIITIHIYTLPRGKFTFSSGSSKLQNIQWPQSMRLLDSSIHLYCSYRSNKIKVHVCACIYIVLPNFHNLVPFCLLKYETFYISNFHNLS